MNSQIFKIVVLGEGRVGKTSISLKYVNNEFNEDQESTINASYLEKKLVLENHQSVKLAIWVSPPPCRTLQGRKSTTQLPRSTTDKPWEPSSPMTSLLLRVSKK